jgi:hypothetical protein
MPRAARAEGHASLRHPEHGVTDLEPVVTLEDVPHLVLTKMEVQRRSGLRGCTNSSTVNEPLVFLVCALIVTEPPNGIGNGVPSPGKTAKGSTGLDIATSGVAVDIVDVWLAREEPGELDHKLTAFPQWRHSARTSRNETVRHQTS